jgi:hypothetical protein
MKRLEHRLRQLEACSRGSHEMPDDFEIWIEQKDGTMRGMHGEMMPREAFEQRPFPRTIVVLPDNERDPFLAVSDRSQTRGCQRIEPLQH